MPIWVRTEYFIAFIARVDRFEEGVLDRIQEALRAIHARLL